MAVGDLAELRILSFVNSNPVQSALGFVALSGSSGWRDAIGLEWIIHIQAAWLALQSHNANLADLVVVDVVPGTAADVVVPVTPFTFGTGGGADAVQTAAALISWRSDLQGRSNRGRTYQGGLSTDQILNGRLLESDALDRQTTLADAILATWGPAGASAAAQFVVISRQLNGVVRPVPVGVPITSYVLPRILGTQRERMRI